TPDTTVPEPTTTTVADDPVTSRAMAAAPYLYEGWGDPPEATAVMEATGVSWFTMAFVLSSGGCTPAWDGQRPLAGGVDEATIASIRAAGGDVVVSFGGWSGTKLEEDCGSADDLAAAYQQVIDAHDLKAIDLDVEATAYTDPAARQRIVEALGIVRAANPGLVVYVTIGAARNGPDAALIQEAAAAGLEIDGWTIMPFNFGGVGEDMGALSVQAAEGLHATLVAAYGYDDAEAYAHMGISSMNGVTDVGETIDAGDFGEMLAYAEAHDLARFTFWSVNRDRPCAGAAADACSGIDQTDWEFTSIIADYAR
ncbi:MAG: chitinase, partial [Actinomycetota bacterium]|nr:chitinase [Actinomycetota bacterium]